MKTSKAALALAAVVLSAAACGGTDSGGSASKEFTFWSMHKQDEPRAKIVQAAAAEFTKATGIKVNIVFQGRENIKKLQPTLVSGNVPADLVDNGQSNILNLMQVTGQAKDLSAVYQQKAGTEGGTVGDAVPDGYEKLITDKGAKYMVPTTLHTWQVWYDGARLPEVAAKPPQTFDELIAALDASKAVGRPAIAVDGDILGYVAQWVSHSMMRELGPGGFAKVLTDKSGAGFDNPGVLKAAQNIERIAKGKYMIDGWDTSKFPAIQQKWAQGQADFLFLGSYGPGETAEVAGPKFAYRSFPFPKTAAGFASNEVNLFGFAVPAKAKNAENAEKFIAFFMDKKWLGQIPGAEKVLTVRTDTDTPPQLADVKKVLDAGGDVHLQLDGVSTMADWKTKIYDPMCKDLFGGKISAADFVAQLKTKTVDWWKVNA
ncbi:ABC transporter substrate-binding protein [Nonomuraea sp. NPDC050556]|uniref:ABC transporter substrate-binding protein n=1 Tax=Nonomuraea sp. NPDC050556 TaxID=3364369 RepID=UPI003796FF83